MWLLDVDGVLNVRRPAWGPDLHRGTAHSQGVDWPIRWAPGLIDAILRLHYARLVEVRWCTTWCPDADVLERLFALPELGRALSTADLATVHDADPLKLAAARRVRAEGRRLVWTDDTAVPASGPLHDELTADGHGLLIRPQPKRGLRPRDLTRIETFARTRRLQVRPGA